MGDKLFFDVYSAFLQPLTAAAAVLSVNRYWYPAPIQTSTTFYKIFLL